MSILRPMTKSIYLYMGKCVAACGVAWFATQVFPEHDMSWLLISIVLVLSPDSTESIPLAITRIKANLLAASSSLLVMLLPIPALAGLALALIMTVALCHLFHVMSGSRPALAAAIIILLHNHESLHRWDTALMRLIAVVSGSIVGLGITAMFHGHYWRNGSARIDRTSE